MATHRSAFTATPTPKSTAMRSNARIAAIASPSFPVSRRPLATYPAPRPSNLRRLTEARRSDRPRPVRLESKLANTKGPRGVLDAVRGVVAPPADEVMVQLALRVAG